jgi:hypothetical protein
MHGMGLEPTILACEWAETLHALGCAAAAISFRMCSAQEKQNTVTVNSKFLHHKKMYTWWGPVWPRYVVTIKKKRGNINRLITTGFLDFVHPPEFYKQENTTFQKLDLFPSSGEGGGAPTLLGTLEKTYLNHRRCQTRELTTWNKSTIYSWHEDESMGCNRKTQSKK